LIHPAESAEAWLPARVGELPFLTGLNRVAGPKPVTDRCSGKSHRVEKWFGLDNQPDGPASNQPQPRRLFPRQACSPCAANGGEYGEQLFTELLASRPEI
jgi:hypothetical protein